MTVAAWLCCATSLAAQLPGLGAPPLPSSTPQVVEPASPSSIPNYGEPTLAPPRPRNDAVIVDPQVVPTAGTAPISIAPANNIPTRAPTGPASAAAPAGGAMAPVAEARRQRDAAVMIDQLLTLPPELRIEGRPLTLLEWLPTLPDPTSRITATSQYWRLSAALAEAHIALAHERRVEQMGTATNTIAQARQRPDLAWDYQARNAAARADRQLALLNVAAAQQRLAEWAPSGAGNTNLPLALDRPHVGAYLTHFQRIYASTPASSNARLLDRTLPWRAESVQTLALALVAAHDQFDATTDAWGRGGCELSDVWQSIDRLAQTQRQFVAAVTQYNIDIASYALAIPHGPLRGDELVGMLIPNQRAAGVDGRTLGTSGPGGITPATFDQPLPAQGGVGAPRGFGPQQARKIPSTSAAQVALFAPLIDLSPAQRAQQLTSALHLEHRRPTDEDLRPVTLGECLAAASREQRRNVLATYWRLREQTARHFLSVDRQEQLDYVAQLVTERLDQPGFAELMLRLRTVRLAGQAEQVQTRLEMAAAQRELAELCGWTRDAQWPLAVTAPHGGPYRLASNEPQSGAVGASLPERMQLLTERAAAVVTLDAARAELTQSLERGASPASVVDLIERQYQAARVFLFDVTQYNLAIAEYALRQLPAEATPQQVTAALVLPTP